MSEAIVVDRTDNMGVGAPQELRGHADATWSAGEDGTQDIYCFAITRNGAAVRFEIKKIGPVMGSSTQAEGYASLRLSDAIVWATHIDTQMGRAPAQPPLLLSDNESNLRIASGQATVCNAKHALRRWAILVERVREREIRLGHVSDKANVVDFGTKWVEEAKLEMSLAHLTGSRARAAFEGVPMPEAKKVRATLGEKAQLVAM